MKRTGFSLVELLLVMGIIGILASVLVPNLTASRRAAIDRAGQLHIQNVYKAAAAYLAETNANTMANCGTGGSFSVGNYSINQPRLPSMACTVSLTSGNLTVSGTWQGGSRNSASAP